MMRQASELQVPRPPRPYPLTHEDKTSSGSHQTSQKGHFREGVDEEPFQALSTLREKILTLLEELQIRVINDDEACPPVPGIELGDGIMCDTAGPDAEVTVEDAFFFRQY